MALVQRWSSALSECLGTDLPSWKQVAIVVGGYFALKTFYSLLRCASSSCCKTMKPKLQVTNWKKDKVYLFQFPRSPFIPNVSPFCLKIETYLRAKKIDHEVHYSVEGRSKYGLLPFIELNGEQIADSQLIIFALEKAFGTEEKFSTEDKVKARLLDRFVDQHTFYCLNKFKFENGFHFAGLILDLANVPGFFRPIAQRLLARRFKKKVGERIGLGLGRFSDAEFRDLLNRDLETLVGFLGNKKFFFGNSITYADCSVFGQLSAVYFIPTASYGKQILHDKYQPLVQFLENMRAEVWPNDFTK